MKNRSRCKSFRVFILLLGISVPAAYADRPKAADHPAPQFEKLFSKYPTILSSEKQSFIKSPIDWSSNRLAKRYKTRISSFYQNSTGPNFSESYILVDDIGCGTACRVIFVIDPRTGKIYAPKISAPVEFQLNSTLIVFNPISSDQDTYEDCMGRADGPPQVLAFDGADFKKIRTSPCWP